MPYRKFINHRVLQGYDIPRVFDDMKTQFALVTHDKGLLLIGFAGTGFVQVFLANLNITLDFIFITIMTMGIMSLLGIIKHMKAGEPSPKEFLIKTAVQLGVTAGVILLGYMAAVFFYAMNKILISESIENPVPPASALYFIYAGYTIMFTYHFLKSCDLIDQISPRLLPKWFSAPFRRFRETGNFIDLLNASQKLPAPEGSIEPRDQTRYESSDN